ncbi:MAG TPA: adenylate/guanylate cyclase domain-containing protein [Candidatus Binatia bacterium]|nr:adenylate/guanylate cyclase domain-containing protein [Candidatus Binatia bacterium]
MEPAADVKRVFAKLTWTQLLGNLVGGLLTWFYFRFVDFTAPQFQERISGGEIAFFVVFFGALITTGIVWGSRWARPLDGSDPASSVDAELVRRRAIMVPYVFGALAFAGWIGAGLIWGVLYPIIWGIFTPGRSLRSIFGITCVAGTVTAALVFFAVEHQWRRVLPSFFPGGDLSAVPGVLRLRVRTRLLVIFVMLSVIPLSVLGVLAYTRAAALPGVDPVAAPRIVENMLVFIVFIVAVGTLAAIGLSLYVAGSVAGPLGQLQGAMRDVEHGDLETRCPVVTNDEIGAVAEGFNRMVGGLREREFLKETFGKYVSREIRDEILAGRVTLEGQTQEVTVLFADLRDFTPWVEATSPREVVHDLNAYFTEMDQAIREHRGLVLQFIGDEIEAAFGAPVAYPAHAEMAVRAALEMRRRLGAWNAERVRTGKAPLRHGIGIHTGSVLAGNIGSAERHSYALVGDPVNLASRIQSLNKEFGSDILVSGATRLHLDGRFDLVELPAVRVKGKSVEVEVYRLV